MQSITEDIIDGSCCALCNQYFEHPKKDEKTGKSVGIYVHDYPVACWECHTPECGYQKADVKTYGS